MSKKKQSTTKELASLQAQYSAKNIQQLDPREHIRRRPGMYVGGVGKRALHFLIFEVIDRAITSTIIGRCDHISITLCPDNIVIIQDTDEVVPEQLATGQYMFSSSKDNGSNPDHYSYLWHQRPVLSGGTGYLEKDGLHRITIMTVNAMCTFMTIQFRHNDFVWKRTYREGVPQGAIQQYQTHDSKSDGVIVTFQPDFTIMEKNDFDLTLVREYCQKLTYIFPNLTIILKDERPQQHRQDVLHYPDGIQAMVRDLNRDKQPLHKIEYKHEVITNTDRVDRPYDTIVEIAFQYTDSDETILHGYTNTVFATEVGTHIEGFRHALMGYINTGRYNPVEWEEASRGLTAIISVSHCDPQYESKAQLTLINPDIFDAVLQTTYALLVEAKLRNLIRKHLQNMV